MVKPVSIKAIEAATDVSWQDWCAFLEEAGAGTIDHNGIVKKARTFRPISGWWAQEIAVAYEQHIGRRKPGQTSDGLFTVSVSRTIEGSLEAAHTAWCAFAAGLDAIDAQKPKGLPTTSATPKRLYWRCKFEDESAVTVSMEAKNASKVLVVVEHKKLRRETQIEEKKHIWSTLLAECFDL